jgi:hypothetical protein
MRNSFRLLQQHKADGATLHFPLDGVPAAIKLFLGKSGRLLHDVVLDADSEYWHSSTGAGPPTKALDGVEIDCDASKRRIR